MISYKHQFIFVHIPRTAGTSIENFLLQFEDDEVISRVNHPDQAIAEKARTELFLPCLAWRQHLTIGDIRNLLVYGVNSSPWAYKDMYFRVAPTSCFSGNAHRFDAMFKFAVVRNPWDRMVSEVSYLGARGFLKGERIRDRIIELCRTDIVENHRFDIDQFGYLSVDGRLAVDHVIRFERLEEGIAEVCRRLALPYAPLANVKPYGDPDCARKPYWTFYDAFTRRLVHEQYRRDIEFWGYRFGT